jgi:hypothetical protein
MPNDLGWFTARIVRHKPVDPGFYLRLMESGWKTWRTTELGGADRTQGRAAAGRAERQAQVVAVVRRAALAVVAPERRGAVRAHRAVAAERALRVAVVRSAAPDVVRPTPVTALARPLHAADSLRARAQSPVVSRPAAMTPAPQVVVQAEATGPARVATARPTTVTAPHRPLSATQGPGLLVRPRDRAA